MKRYSARSTSLACQVIYKMNKVLLLSIRPVYSEKIFSGEKRVELRRLRPSVNKGDLVLVYTSSPSCELTGAFVVGKVEAGTPDSLWRKVRRRCGIDKKKYDAYYQGAAKAYGIYIRHAWRLDHPVKLASIRSRSARFHPPQSYRYFDSADLNIFMPSLTIQGLLSAGAAGRSHATGRRGSVASYVRSDRKKECQID